MDKTLQLFKLFHYLKEVTTKSYSLKKLQDLIERRLDRNTTIEDGEYEDFIQEFGEINTKLKKSLTDLEDLIK